MIDESLFVKYIPDDMLYRYFKNESDQEERFIVEHLKDHKLNIERFLEFKKKSIGKNLVSPSLSKEVLARMVEYSKAFRQNSVKSISPEIKPVAAAGQIWSTKRVIQLGKKEFMIASPMCVYILTNPESYPILDEDVLNSYPEYRTMRILLVSLLTNLANQDDYIISDGNTILGAPFMIETNTESNMLVDCLNDYLGTLNKKQIEELLSIYETTNSLPDIDKRIYRRAKKGEYFDEEYGDKYEFKTIESINIKFLSEQVDALEEFFLVKDVSEELVTIIYSSKFDFSKKLFENLVTSSDRIVKTERLKFFRMEKTRAKYAQTLIEDKESTVRLNTIEGHLYLVIYSTIFKEVSGIHLKKGKAKIYATDKDINLGNEKRGFTSFNINKLAAGTYELYITLGKVVKSFKVVIK